MGTYQVNREPPTLPSAAGSDALRRCRDEIAQRDLEHFREEHQRAQPRVRRRSGVRLALLQLAIREGREPGRMRHLLLRQRFARPRTQKAHSELSREFGPRVGRFAHTSSLIGDQLSHEHVNMLYCHPCRREYRRLKVVNPVRPKVIGGAISAGRAWARSAYREEARVALDAF